MACPTCDHTLQNINAKPPIFWCPRCGTIKDGDSSEEPTIVKRTLWLCDIVLEQQMMIGYIHPEKLRMAEIAVRECCGNNM